MNKAFFMKNLGLLGLLLLGCSSMLWSQGLSHREALQKRASLSQTILRLAPEENFLQKGKDYRYVYPRVEDSHVLAGPPIMGKVKYEGLEFSGLSLSYDIYNDLVFTTQIYPQGNRYLILSSHKLDEFWLEELHFIRIDESPDSSLFTPGFYQLVYEDPARKLLVKWRVKRNHYASSVASSKAGQKPYKFVSNNTHYLFMKGQVYPISNKKDLLEGLENPEGVKNYLKKNKVKLRNPQTRTFSDQLAKICAYLASQGL